MTRRELVKAAIAHKPTPRVPYAIDFCQDAWEKLKAVADDKTQEQFIDDDVQSIPVPWWDWFQLGEDWKGADAPKSAMRLMGIGSYEGILERIKEARDKSDKYFLVRIYGSHFEKAYSARGFENFMADIGGEPKFAKRLMNRIVERNLVMLENFLQVPEIDGVLLGSDWGSQRGPLMSPAVWDDMIRPGEQAEYELVHSYGKDVWVHSCGDIEPLIGRLVEMGLDVLNPLQPEAMDIAHVKRTYGGKLAFWGGISTQKTLPYGTPDEVRAEARATRDLLSAGGGYVLSPAQSIQGDVPLENMLALLEVAKEGK
jgi:uroporphyrinogen decarboxylase